VFLIFFCSVCQAVRLVIMSEMNIYILWKGCNRVCVCVCEMRKCMVG
jgi:hypothetical protein